MVAALMICFGAVALGALLNCLHPDPRRLDLRELHAIEAELEALRLRPDAKARRRAEELVDRLSEIAVRNGLKEIELGLDEEDDLPVRKTAGSVGPDAIRSDGAFVDYKTAAPWSRGTKIVLEDGREAPPGTEIRCGPYGEMFGKKRRWAVVKLPDGRRVTADIDGPSTGELVLLSTAAVGMAYFIFAALGNRKPKKVAA